MDDKAIGNLIFGGLLVPITAAGLALAVYTKDIRLGFYMAACLLGGCSIFSYYYKLIKDEIALYAHLASAPLVVPLRFPYRALITATPDERSVEMRLETIRAGASLTLQRVDAEGRIAISSQEGLLGFLSERDASALAQSEVENLFVQLHGVRRVGQNEFRLRVRIDTWNPNHFSGRQSASTACEARNTRTGRVRGGVD